MNLCLYNNALFYFFRPTVFVWAAHFYEFVLEKVERKKYQITHSMLNELSINVVLNFLYCQIENKRNARWVHSFLLISTQGFRLCSLKGQNNIFCLAEDGWKECTRKMMRSLLASLVVLFRSLEVEMAACMWSTKTVPVRTEH